MVKVDIIRSIEIQLGISHEEATVQVEQILTILKDQLTQGEPVLISGFGQWKVRNKPARIGRNPKTKRRVPNFGSPGGDVLSLKCLAERNLEKLQSEVGKSSSPFQWCDPPHLHPNHSSFSPLPSAQQPAIFFPPLIC